MMTITCEILLCDLWLRDVRSSTGEGTVGFPLFEEQAAARASVTTASMASRRYIRVERVLRATGQERSALGAQFRRTTVAASLTLLLGRGILCLRCRHAERLSEVPHERRSR